MNFHNISQGKVLDSVGLTTNKDQKQLYESMFSKHFQIIQTFLGKINELYNKNDDFQNKICSLEDSKSKIYSGIEKIENNTKNIHYEFRTTHLMIDKKLNTVNTDLNSMQEQLKIMQLDMPLESYLSSKGFVNKSSNLRSRKSKKSRKMKKHASDSYKIAVLSSNNISMTANARVRSQRQDEISSKKDEEHRKSVFLQQNRSINKIVSFQKLNSKEAIGDNMSSQSSVNLRMTPEVSMKCFKEIDVDSPLNPYQDQFSQSENSEEGCSQQWVKSEIKKSLDSTISTINLNLSTQITKLTQLINQRCLKLKQDLTTQMVKPDQLNQVQSFILFQLSNKTTDLHSTMNNNIQQLKIELSQSNKTGVQFLFSKWRQQHGELVQKKYFQRTLDNLANAVNQQLAKKDRFFASKLETKRALQFLDDKLNKVKAQEKQCKSKMGLSGSDDPCLKINKCDSMKKFDLMSEKSVKDTLNGSKDNQLFKSVQVSIRDIEPQNHLTRKDSQLKRVFSQILQWKSPRSTHLTSPKDTPMVRSLSRSKDPQDSILNKRSSVPDRQVGLKQWRQKVVKVLKKQDRRKRKVTFR